MKTLLALLAPFLLSGCAISQQAGDAPRCPKAYKNSFSQIINERYTTVNGTDTTTLHEIRFECTRSALYTHKALYNIFGKWDEAIFPSNRTFPILVWNDVDLLGTGKKYTVLTNGLEEWKHTYASVMVLDEQQRDLLAASTAEQTALTSYFAELLKNQDHKKKEFYEVYWKMVDPKRWEAIKGK